MKRVLISGGPRGIGHRSITVRPEATGYGWKGNNLVVSLRRAGEPPEVSLERVGKSHGIKLAPFDEESGLNNGNPPSVGDNEPGFDIFSYEVSDADLAHYDEDQPGER